MVFTRYALCLVFCWSCLLGCASEKAHPAATAAVNVADASVQAADRGAALVQQLGPGRADRQPALHAIHLSVHQHHPGVVGDAGAYGAMPWLDLPRNYGAFIVLEATATLGSQLRIATKPELDKVFDALH